MNRLFAGVCAALFAISFVSAEEKKEDKPVLSGIWTKDIDGAIISFDFSKKDKVVVMVEASDKSITMTCKSTVDKDGVVKATAEKIENKNEFPSEIKKGYEFKMKVKVDGKKATISNFEAENADAAKNIVEGEYTKKEAK